MTNRLTDLDIAVTKSYQRIGEDLAQVLKAKIIHYPQFMTMTLQCPKQAISSLSLFNFKFNSDGLKIDISQTRKEHYSEPAILPKVSPAGIEQDLQRRDFTINAMALELGNKGIWQKKLLDPFNGQRDLNNGIIRILHPLSFIDDPTRIFRAVRFAIRFGFKIEHKTKLLLEKAVENNLLNLLSGERILYEIKMVLQEKKVKAILETLQSYGISENIFERPLNPKLFSESQILDADLRLAHFFVYVPESTWKRFPLTAEVMNSARAIKYFSKKRNKLMRAKRPSQIYQILHQLPRPTLKILMQIEPKVISKKIKLYLRKYVKVKIATSGKTLKALKIAPGPIYAKILDKLLYQLLDGKIKTKEEEIEYIKLLIKQTRTIKNV